MSKLANAMIIITDSCRLAHALTVMNSKYLIPTTASIISTKNLIKIVKITGYIFRGMQNTK